MITAILSVPATLKFVGPVPLSRPARPPRCLTHFATLPTNTMPTPCCTAKSYDSTGNTAEATRWYRKTYFYGAGSSAATEAEARLTTLGQALTPQNAEELAVRADKLFNAKKYAEALKAYNDLSLKLPGRANPPGSVKPHRRRRQLRQNGRFAERLQPAPCLRQ